VFVPFIKEAILNDQQSQRQALLEALNEAGMKPTEFTAKDGTQYVILTLLDTRFDPIIIPAEDPELRAYFRNAARNWPHLAFLYICSGSSGAPWRIGVMGHNGLTDQDYTPDEWKEVETVEEAVKEFRGLWENRDALLNAFAGDLS
jgi:hypothetical protein